jgi:hypothetical protein
MMTSAIRSSSKSLQNNKLSKECHHHMKRGHEEGQQIFR